MEPIRKLLSDVGTAEAARRTCRGLTVLRARFWFDLDSLSNRRGRARENGPSRQKSRGRKLVNLDVPGQPGHRQDRGRLRGSGEPLRCAGMIGRGRDHRPHGSDRIRAGFAENASQAYSSRDRHPSVILPNGSKQTSLDSMVASKGRTSRRMGETLS